MGLTRRVDRAAYRDAERACGEQCLHVFESNASKGASRKVIVITSDHGGMDHGSTLYPELIETFTIFWRPERRIMHPRDERLSGTIDIGGTVIAGLSSLPDSLEVPETPVNSAGPDPAVVRQLKALGYIE